MGQCLTYVRPIVVIHDRTQFTDSAPDLLLFGISADLLRTGAPNLPQLTRIEL